MLWMLLLLLSFAAVVGHSACKRAGGLELRLQLEDSQCTHTNGTKTNSKERQRPTDTETQNIYSFKKK